MLDRENLPKDSYLPQELPAQWREFFRQAFELAAEVRMAQQSVAEQRATTEKAATNISDDGLTYDGHRHEQRNRDGQRHEEDNRTDDGCVEATTFTSPVAPTTPL